MVIRPDSPRFEGDTAAAQIVWIADRLADIFGYTVNEKKFAVLNPKVGIIYGDGLKPEEIKEAIDALVKHGYSAATCVYGMGGGLLQKHNRDTQRSVFKCSAQKRNGEWLDIHKTPLDASKASKKGRLKLVWSLGAHGRRLITVPLTDNREDVLVTVFENGVVTKSWNWDEVKANAQINLLEETYGNH